MNVEAKPHPAGLHKTILAFGDSLTWGLDPRARDRHRFENRWTTILERQLPNTRVIPEGLSGRTTSFDDQGGTACRNGADILPVLLGSHYPLDLVIIMLGTNDLKPHICGTAIGAATGMERLATIAALFPYEYDYQPPRLLIVSPPHFRNGADGPPIGGRSIAESKLLAPLYRQVAERRNCGFFDAADCATASSVDGVHLDASNTRAIGIGLVPVVQALLYPEAA